MSDNDPFGDYVEALYALCTVESRQRDALRKAIEAAAATVTRAKEHMADQQRMYDRAAKDAQDAERLLAELRSMVGLSLAASIAPPQPAATPPPLIEIRGQIRDVAQWADETRPVAESLLRTKARLANAPTPPDPAPAPVRPTGARSTRKLPVGVVGTIVAVVVMIIVVVLIAH